MVVDHDVLIVHQDFEETGGTMAGPVPKQWGPCVQAELVGDPIRNKRPGRVNVSAAVKVGPDRRKPASQRLGVDQRAGKRERKRDITDIGRMRGEGASGTCT